MTLGGSINAYLFLLHWTTCFFAITIFGVAMVLLASRKERLWKDLAPLADGSLPAVQVNTIYTKTIDASLKKQYIIQMYILLK